MKFKRIFLIVLDSLGIGEAKDAYKFDDEDEEKKKLEDELKEEAEDTIREYELVIDEEEEKNIQ